MLVFTNINTGWLTLEDDNLHFYPRQNYKYDKDYKTVNVILLRNVVNSTINSVLWPWKENIISYKSKALPVRDGTWPVEVHMHRIPDSAVDGGERTVSLPTAFLPLKSPSPTHW